MPNAEPAQDVRLQAEIECWQCTFGTAVASVDCRTDGGQLFLCGECLTAWRRAVRDDLRLENLCPRCAPSRLGLWENAVRQQGTVRRPIDRGPAADQLLADADDAMRAEGILVDVRNRVINRLRFGHPAGSTEMAADAAE
jgi:hypothetical protein